MMNLRALWGDPFHRRSSAGSSISFLSTVPLFEKLSRRQIEKINAILHIRDYNADEIVFRQGDPGVGMYIVRSGSLRVCREFDDSTYHDVAVMHPSDFFGEIALLNNSARSATIVATEQSTLMGLFREDLRELMDSDPRLGLSIIYAVARVIAERLRLATSGAGMPNG